MLPNDARRMSQLVSVTEEKSYDNQYRADRSLIYRSDRPLQRACRPAIARTSAKRLISQDTSASDSSLRAAGRRLTEYGLDDRINECVQELAGAALDDQIEARKAA